MTGGGPFKPGFGLSGAFGGNQLHGAIPNARVFTSGRRDLARTICANSVAYEVAIPALSLSKGWVAILRVLLDFVVDT